MPNGNRRCRQILLVADHNAYHAGQIVQVRKALGAWRGEGIAMTRATKAQLVLLRQLVSLY